MLRRKNCCRIIVLWVLGALLLALVPLAVADEAGQNGAVQSQNTTITYAYDALGRLVRADYGPDMSILYAYDGAGNVVTRRVARAMLVYLPVLLRRR